MILACRCLLFNGQHYARWIVWKKGFSCTARDLMGRAARSLYMICVLQGWIWISHPHIYAHRSLFQHCFPLVQMESVILNSEATVLPHTKFSSLNVCISQHWLCIYKPTKYIIHILHAPMVYIVCMNTVHRVYNKVQYPQKQINLQNQQWKIETAQMLTNIYTFFTNQGAII